MRERHRIYVLLGVILCVTIILQPVASAARNDKSFKSESGRSNYSNGRAHWRDRDTKSTSGTMNQAPVISGNPATVIDAGGYYDFLPSANDADGDSLTFSIQGKPSWASFNAINGKLYGIPNDNHVGSYNNIVISVSDGSVSVALPAFNLTVSSGPEPVTVPSVLGLMQANAESAIVAAGLAVGTIATASSDSVPAGAVISQTPEGGSEVTQGATVNLTVSSGAATIIPLSWIAPATRSDGTPLSISEIAGYRVYSGMERNNLVLMSDISDGSATSYSLTGLTSGTHYFALTTYDYSNNESTYSDIVSRTVP